MFLYLFLPFTVISVFLLWWLRSRPTVNTSKQKHETIFPTQLTPDNHNKKNSESENYNFLLQFQLSIMNTFKHDSSWKQCWHTISSKGKRKTNHLIDKQHQVTIWKILCKYLFFSSFFEHTVLDFSFLLLFFIILYFREKLQK